MKKQLLAIGIFLFLILVGLSGCIDRETKEFSGEYNTDESTILKVANINGKIKISSWNYDTVSLDAVSSSNLNIDDLENIEIVVNESSNVIDIETKYLVEGIVNIVTDMTIKVPNFITIDTVSTSNGEIRLSGIKGNVSAKSSNGQIIIEDVDGYVQADTSNKGIEIKKTTGIKNLHSSNGKIYAEIFDFKENISIDTSNKDVILHINPSLNADLEISTSNGEINMRDILVDLTISEDKFKVGTLGEGGNKIYIHTSNGDIYLYELDI